MSWKDRQIKNILVPVDFSTDSKEALGYARTLANRFNATLLLMHVIDSAPYSVTDTLNIVEHRRSLVKIARTLLESWVEELRREKISTKQYLTNGVPYEEILAKSRRAKAHLIIMGTHGRTGLRHLILGSVAERVVRLSTCPVLTVRLSARRKSASRVPEKRKRAAVTLFAL